MSGSVLLSAIVGVIVFLIWMSVMLLSARKESVRDRMERITDDAKGSEEVANELTEGQLRADRSYSSLGMLLEQILRALGVDTEKFRKASTLRFYRAGIQSPDGPIFFLFFKYVINVFLFIAGLMLIFSKAVGMVKLLYFLIAIIIIVIGVFGADMYLQNERIKREKKLQRSFPDTLDLLLVCVESGLALDGALARVCRELGLAYPEITMELNRTRIELTLLNDRTQALSNLAERTDMLSFRTLVTTLLQSERFGTSLTDTLRVLSEDARNTRLMMAETIAGRLPVMMTIPMIILMMPALFIVILAPAIMKTLASFHQQ